MALKKKNNESEELMSEMQKADFEELPEETTEDTALRRLTNATQVVKGIFHLNDDYVVTAFNDKGKSMNITLNNADFTISIGIKDIELYGIK